jgi:hypothetical protein
VAAAVLIWTLAAARPATAAPLLVNGGFESGFLGWTRVDQADGLGSFELQSGTTSPISGFPVPVPPEGAVAAMSDSEGPGSHVLYQDFVVPDGVTAAALRFDLFIGNRDAGFFAPPSLDFSLAAFNQQARVDVLRAGADPFSVLPADVLLTAYQTLSGDPLVSGYTTHLVDVTTLLAAQAGQTLRLRFAEVDNVFIFQLGVDDVQVDAEVAQQVIPEPATLWLIGSGAAAAGLRRRRRAPRRTPSA